MISAATESVPFERDRSSRMVPVLTGILVFLATLALLAASILGKAASAWQDAYTGHITVQVPAELDQAVNDLFVTLSEDERIDRIYRVTEEQQAELIGQWVGDVNLAGLELPIMVDIELAYNNDEMLAEVAYDIEQALPDAEITMAGAWLERLGELAHLVRSGAWAALLITLGAVGVMVIAVTRAGLAIHAEAVALLHMIGATDEWVAKQFQTRMLSSTAVGAAAGMVAALLALFALRLLAPASADTGLMISMAPGLGGWIGALLLPIAVIALAAITARLTVLSDLKHLL